MYIQQFWTIFKLNNVVFGYDFYIHYITQYFKGAYVKKNCKAEKLKHKLEHRHV
jgi:hypothetical protein